MASGRTAHVAGVVTYDHLLYPTTSPNDGYSTDTQLVIRLGQAGLVARLLETGATSSSFKVAKPELRLPSATVFAHFASSIVELKLDTSDRDHDLRYSVHSRKVINSRPTWHSPTIESEAAKGSKTLVVVGSSEIDGNLASASDVFKRLNPQYVIHQMSRPLATGPVWDLIRNGPFAADGSRDPDCLAVIIDADDLREEGIALSKGLSWESTAEDFVRNLGSNGLLDTLVTCPNLFVRFGLQGVIHHRGREATDPKLYYNPRQIEGEHRRSGQTEMIGINSAFTAGFTLGFAEADQPNNDKGLKFGVAAANRLESMKLIHKSNSDTDGPDFALERIMNELSSCKGFATANIPSARISTGDQWSIFGSVTGDPAEVARNIVTQGPDKALASCPIQTFGNLRAVERGEQESLRAVVDAVQERLKHEHPRPTSIGLVGPPGAGKKFTARNLSDYICTGKLAERLEYDVRLMKEEGLIVACHAIRDSTACRQSTVVVFENFEAVLEPGNQLLKSFLAIMREGRFEDAGRVHLIGSPLMFFLINREEIGSRMSRPMSPMPLSRANTDFGVGRLSIIDDTLPVLDDLHGLINVTGPNPKIGPQDPLDRMFTIRRGLMLRQLLQERHPHLVVNDRIQVDEPVLRALLLVPNYKHGLRSLEKIISTSRLTGRKKFDVAALPPQEQVQLHVDGQAFAAQLRAPKLAPALREKIAEGLAAVYRKRREAMANNPEELAQIRADRAMQDWDELPPELKESTRIQADDITRKLRAVNCFMLEEERGEPLVPVQAFTPDQLDMLAEMEHERFNAERLQRQWRLGKRDSKQRTTPFLIPWRDLAEEWRDVDRVMVEAIPKVLANAGWKVYRVRGEDEEEDAWTILDQNGVKPLAS